MMNYYTPEFEKFWTYFSTKPHIAEFREAVCPTIKEVAWSVWQEAQKVAPTKVVTEIVYRDADEVYNFGPGA